MILPQLLVFYLQVLQLKNQFRCLLSKIYYLYELKNIIKTNNSYTKRKQNRYGTDVPYEGSLGIPCSTPVSEQDQLERKHCP